MKLIKLKSPLWSLFVAALLVSLPGLGWEAQARGGGGGHGGGGYHSSGGYSGGSFREGGGHAEGYRGGEAHRGQGGETVYHNGSYSHNTNINRNVNVSGNWGAYHGPGWGGVAAGAAAGLAVGTVVGALSAGARPMAISGQTYYYENNTYYQPCYQGTDVSYCVVADPNQ